MQPRLFKMANGHLTLEFDAYDSDLWRAVGAYLEDVLGFDRRGETFDGWDEGIVKSFQRDSLLLKAGWSHWADGDYLQSDSCSGDELLSKLFAAIKPDLSFRPIQDQ
ncbi:hypothetical protein A3218_00640 [Pseudomonas chlororaphis]|uniref:hypothetical protein n=1 Tax=Pseudomonas chlororaphis TaxID=587753 RepID=UPI000789E96A|nr:hypothetical protein [Pseudomonas chlororaphis]AMS12907.1 hypothetical protein A3218_00640 [Pseudomonas chlororaphis]WDH33051.1 hypothetical protein PUP62_19600 [Pseudomonas chlororaphis]WDH39133.1 hypothetical protein PUP51_19595 [Pseudomonas chlororaphis]WDH51072.1 hypothetical protein PUP75_19215 [Pseudomonas chlororaphis]